MDQENPKETKTLGMRICEALGLDPMHTGAIEIFIPPQEPPLIDVHMLDWDKKLGDVDWSDLLKGANVTVTIERFDDESSS